jgi:hypothetical protein
MRFFATKIKRSYFGVIFSILFAFVHNEWSALFYTFPISHFLARFYYWQLMGAKNGFKYAWLAHTLGNIILTVIGLIVLKLAF